jgi:hypothetical protein
MLQQIINHMIPSNINTLQLSNTAPRDISAQQPAEQLYVPDHRHYTSVLLSLYSVECNVTFVYTLKLPHSSTECALIVTEEFQMWFMCL